MPRRPRILLDVDGVLTHGFVEKVCEHLRGFGHEVEAHHVDQWDVMKALNIPAHGEDEVYRRMKLPGVAMQFEPIPGSIEFVAELQTWSDVYAVTSPMGGPYWAADREDWLFKHYNISRYRVASIRDKFIVRGEALVDDKLSHLIEWHKEFPSGKAILWRIPPNRHDKWHTEARTYEELRTLLEPLKDLR